MRSQTKGPWFLSRGALGFVAGFAAGGVLIAAVAAWSSRLYLEASRLLFATNESILVGERLQERDLEGALVHAAAWLEIEHGGAAARAFGAERQAWSVGWAIREVFRDRTSADMHRRAEVLHRARMAALWEELGRPEAAERELDRIAEISPKLDRDHWRDAGRLLLANSCKSAGERAENAAPAPGSPCDRFEPGAPR